MVDESSNIGAPGGGRLLEDLLSFPREDLDVEYKGWIDLADKEKKALVAKALIALTNHGGGYLVIGYEESAGIWRPSAKNRPDDLSAFDQDAINGVIERYAEPLFHCETEWVRNPETGALFPVVRAPGNQKVPVRTKRACPCGECVQSNTYYIRRPGPKSEAPQTAREWDDLMRRCVMASRESLMGDIRLILYGARTVESSPSPTEAARNRLDEWVSESRARLDSLVKERLPTQAPSPYEHGVWSVAYAILGEFKSPDLGNLESFLRKAEGGETGWPMWLIQSNEEQRPYVLNGVFECWIAGTKVRNSAHADFWRVSPTGLTYLLRGYQEDSNPEQLEPGTLIDLTIPVWRLGEGLLHSERLARAMEVESGSVLFRVEWEGLAGRLLTSLDLHRDVWGARKSHQAKVSSEPLVPVDQIRPSLVETVSLLVRPLYEVFGLFDPPNTMVAEELEKMRGKVR